MPIVREDNEDRNLQRRERVNGLVAKIFSDHSGRQANEPSSLSRSGAPPLPLINLVSVKVGGCTNCVASA
jgi:hypothetical protein